MMLGGNKQLQVGVVEWEDQPPTVVLNLIGIGQIVLLDATAARELAFLLMESADVMDPPDFFKSDCEISPS